MLDYAESAINMFYMAIMAFGVVGDIEHKCG